MRTLSPKSQSAPADEIMNEARLRVLRRRFAGDSRDEAPIGASGDDVLSGSRTGDVLVGSSGNDDLAASRSPTPEQFAQESGAKDGDTGLRKFPASIAASTSSERKRGAPT